VILPPRWVDDSGQDGKRNNNAQRNAFGIDFRARPVYPCFSMKKVTAFAPATVANVAVGFDILGFAFDGIGDEVTLTRKDSPGITITKISVHPDHLKLSEFSDLPLDPEKNTASVGVLQMIGDFALPFGFDLSIRKGIPLGSGMGGSAASAVAGVLAASRFLPITLDKETLLRYALIGEKVATGDAHADNAAPCLYGGMILAHSVEPAHFISIPFPDDILCVLVHPHMRVDTRQARSILSPTVKLKDFTMQSAHLATFIAGCFKEDMSLIRRSLRDDIIEPQRAHLVPAFKKAQAAAMEQGALGCSLSGSGPSIFAWVEEEAVANRIRDSLLAVFLKEDLGADAWISRISDKGAKISREES
jgi:homoserine kinase